MESVKIANININSVTFNEAISRIEKLIELKKNAYIVTPNVDHIVKLQTDELFFDIYQSASLILCDGMPLIWASKVLGTPIIERVAGSDILPSLCYCASKKKYKIFLLGGPEKAGQKAKENIEKKYPGIQIVGTYSPPFGFENDININKLIVNKIKEAEPDILFVGLGAPKQEKWIYRFKDCYNVPVSIGVGVSIEFMAGMVKRAPVFMQQMGLEWLWRLIMEPHKLWKRYLIDDIKFFYLIYQQYKNDNGTPLS
ncbi:WecB/TagA/CpsF family glycosyltransferase [uncultured Desulfobacter sp.]|uniref:WecB/TagA/CpsF family glycosyltransferase n=1 Tax=uncultured Desulfobacter sp. TaxID=240139 RepID=UPI0029F4E1F1|nr:WecB/TagA/CpsF family glycosyltransferase [uncultured Desulfobacter sp.]